MKEIRRSHYTESQRREAAYRSSGRTACAVRRKRHMRKRKERIRALLIAAAVLAVIIIMISQMSVKTANAASTEDAAGRSKYYTSIMIECGDSLWSIAEKYRTVEYASISDYIREVKEINHLTSDVIKRGCSLCVPYYADAASGN